MTLEEAAENLGATKARTVWRIVVPLMSGGILAGFVTSFATAAVELSATIMLVASESDAPLAYGIYVFMQSAAGRGPGAALGIIAVVIVGLGTYLSHRIIERGRRQPGIQRSWSPKERTHDAPRRVPAAEYRHRGPRPVLRRHRGAEGHQPGDRAGRVLRLSRALGLGQIHPAAGHRRLRPEPTGRILIDGEDVARLPPWKRNVGMVFQSYALWPHMTVRKNVAFGLEERRLSASRDRPAGRTRRWTWWACATWPTAGRPSSPAASSSASRWRAPSSSSRGCCCSTSRCPTWTPTCACRCAGRLRELQRKLDLTTIFVTHDQEEANTTSDRMAVLDDGVIQQVGTPMALYDRPANRFVANFLGTANLLEGTVEASAEGARFRSPEGVEVALRSGQHGPGALVFRPQSVRIGDEDEPAGPDCVRFAGTVSHSEFLGSIIRYAVAVGETVVTVDDQHHQGTAVIPAGCRGHSAVAG